MLKGTDVTLYERTQTGEDAFGAPVYAESPVIVKGVLVGEPDAGEVIDEMRLSGRRLAYTLGIPKGDTHTWEGATVEIFGKKYRAFGAAAQGQEELVPLRWHKKVKVERYE